jgi:Tfp pilus assembly PilM family ATPase
MRGFSRSEQIIGLDIGRASIKAVQVTLRDRTPHVQATLVMRRTSAGHSLDWDEAQRLQRAMHRQGLTGSRLVLVAPSDALVGGSISVPPADKNVGREKIVEMELGRTNKLSPGTFEMAWWDLPTPAHGSTLGKAHALALPHATVEPTLHVLAELGLRVVRTVPGSLALLAAAQRHPIDPRCIAAVLDLGSTRGNLALMYAGRVVHERALPDFNLDELEAALSRRLGVGGDAASFAMSRFGLCDSPVGLVACETESLLAEAVAPLAEEIGMSFAYVSHLYPEAELGQLLLVGGGGRLVGLDRTIGEALDLEVLVVSPASLLPSEMSGDGCDDAALCAALGAALCGEASR